MPIVSTPSFHPDRLIRAVNVRGLTWSKLSEIAEINATTLSNYKNGEVIPSPEQLYKMAVALELPEEYFLKDQFPNSRLVGPRLFRASAGISKKAATQAEAILEWAAECVEFTEGWLRLPNPNFLDDYTDIVEPLSLDELAIEAIATRVRKSLGYENGPIENFFVSIERQGIPILKYPNPDRQKKKLDGLSQRTRSGRPFCALFSDSNSTLSREYFSLAHELGHLVLHSNVKESRLHNIAEGKILEEQAHRFASAFLLPKDEFLSEVFAPTLKTFEYLKRKWRVSMAAMIRRCYDTGHIDYKRYSSLNVQMSQRKIRNPEPLDDLFECENPIFIKKAFQTLVERENYNPEDFSRDLHLSRKDLSLISGLPIDFFQKPQLNDNVIEFK